jgi:hypothetical protein
MRRPKREILEDLAFELRNLGLIIGSFPLYYLLCENRYRVSYVDDIDIVVFDDETLRNLALVMGINLPEKRRLIKDIRKRQFYPGYVYNVVVNYRGIGIDMCIFPDGIVNVINLKGCGTKEIKIGENSFFIPELGAYYITRLHPYAITPHRIKTTSLVINSRGETPKDLADVSKELLREAVLTYGISEKELKKAMNMGSHGRNDKFGEYIRLTYNLPYLLQKRVFIGASPYTDPCGYTPASQTTALRQYQR